MKKSLYLAALAALLAACANEEDGASEDYSSDDEYGAPEPEFAPEPAPAPTREPFDDYDEEEEEEEEPEDDERRRDDRDGGPRAARRVAPQTLAPDPTPYLQDCAFSYLTDENDFGADVVDSDEEPIDPASVIEELVANDEQRDAVIDGVIIRNCAVIDQVRRLRGLAWPTMEADWLSFESCVIQDYEPRRAEAFNVDERDFSFWVIAKGEAEERASDPRDFDCGR